MFNEKYFFDSVREPFFKGSMNQEQVNNILIIKEIFNKISPDPDVRQLAYIYATIFH